MRVRVGTEWGCLWLLVIAIDPGGGYAAVVSMSLSRVHVEKDVTTGCVGPA